MKTAEEIFRSRYQAGADGWMKQSSILECMEEYAKQVAYETLKSAADKYIGKPVKDIHGRILAVSDDIMGTEIVTP